MAKNVVWKFTNQRELNKSEFISYFERKVFSTIRKFEILPKDKVIKMEKSSMLNSKVLKNVFDKKFSVVYSSKPNVSDKNLSDFAEEIFLKVLKGKFLKVVKVKAPLFYLSDKEIELYAKLLKIRGKKQKRNKIVQAIFKEFLEKNPDLEHNVVNAAGQL